MRFLILLLASSTLALTGCGSDDSGSGGSGDASETTGTTGDANADAAAEAPIRPYDPFEGKELEVPEIPPQWRALGVTEELIAPWLSRETAPDTFRVVFKTDVGDIEVECHRAWSPAGADRFYNLVKIGFYKNIVFHQVLDDVVQFGIHPNPVIQHAWEDAGIGDDPVMQTNSRGYLAFAKRKISNSRTTQLFFNLKDNPNYDARGFAPFGRVIDGLQKLDELEPVALLAQKLKAQGDLYVRMSGFKVQRLHSIEFIE